MAGLIFSLQTGGYFAGLQYFMDGIREGGKDGKGEHWQR